MISAAEWAVEMADGRSIKNVSDPKVSNTVKKVSTLRGTQHHRGYKGFVYVTFVGERQPTIFYCCNFHQKAKAAREHAATVSRAFRRLMKDEK